MYNYDQIKRVHLEVTQRCQAACPMCDRNENGGPDNRHITNAELSLDDCKKIFKPEFVKQLESLSMCGNLGDPIVAKDTLEIFKYFRKLNPTMWLSMNTNGGAKHESWWNELANTIQEHGMVIFSVDGLWDTNHLYRQNVVWANVERNMRAFIAAGGNARWDFIVFAHNEHQVEEARQLAEEWGVEKFRVKKSARFLDRAQAVIQESTQAQNRKGVSTHSIQMPENQEHQNNELLRHEEIVKAYGSMHNYYNQCDIKCKVAETKEIFITAEGLFMPCCWTAGRMYKWWHPDPTVEQIWEHIEQAGGKKGLNVIDHDLKSVMEGSLLKTITASWKKKEIKHGRLGVCAMKCGAEFDPFTAQFL